MRAGTDVGVQTDGAELPTDVAMLQQRLMESESGRAAAQGEKQSLQRAMEMQREDLEQKLRTSAENGSLKVRMLEETVQRLSCRGPAQAELARLSIDVSRLLQSEASLKSDLIFAQDRIRKLRMELEQFQCDHAQNSHSTGSHSPRACSGIVQERSGGDDHSDQQLIAEFAERAEKAEIELGKTKQEVEAMKERLSLSASAHAKGAGAIAVASRVRTNCTRQLHLVPVVVSNAVPSL
jgi:hypothetical protein